MASIRKRTWKSGGVTKTAWVVDHFDQRGDRHIKTFPTKKEAGTFRDEMAQQVRRGTYTADSASATVGEVADEWLEHCRAEGLEESTIRQRGQHIELHIKPHLGKAKLTQLTAPGVNKFVTTLRDNGRSLAMRRKVLTSLKTLISHAQITGKVAQNVARGVKITTKEREIVPVMDEGDKMPTKYELRKMIEKVSGRWRPFIVTAIFTGMRASELRGLPWNNVDLKEGVIRVRQRADAWRTIGAPKSKAGVRDIPLAPIVVNTLKEWKLECPKGELDLVFPNTVGNVEYHSNIWTRGFQPLQIACGITEDGRRKDKEGNPIPKGKYGLHALRHAAASLFIEQGWTPKRIQTVLGHASIQMTFDLYGHLFKDADDDREEMKQVQARLLG
ncbi:MAG: site-specific integrase [Alphaproteobacteria bacterium]|nr:site-specific integrase [Alphaproteobacteria bacterium]